MQKMSLIIFILDIFNYEPFNMEHLASNNIVIVNIYLYYNLK